MSTASMLEATRRTQTHTRTKVPYRARRRRGGRCQSRHRSARGPLKCTFLRCLCRHVHEHERKRSASYDAAGRHERRPRVARHGAGRGGSNKAKRYRRNTRGALITCGRRNASRHAGLHRVGARAIQAVGLTAVSEKKAQAKQGRSNPAICVGRKDQSVRPARADRV